MRAEQPVNHDDLLVAVTALLVKQHLTIDSGGHQTRGDREERAKSAAARNR